MLELRMRRSHVSRSSSKGEVRSAAAEAKGPEGRGGGGDFFTDELYIKGKEEAVSGEPASMKKLLEQANTMLKLLTSSTISGYTNASTTETY